MDNTDKYIEILNDRILPNIDYDLLWQSYKTEDKAYAKGVLKILHEGMTEAYSTDSFDCHGDEEYLVTPAVIQSKNTKAVALALLDIDLMSSGELCGIKILTKHGLIDTSDKDLPKEYRNAVGRMYFPFNYGYTADISGDIHDTIAAPTKDIKTIQKDYSNHEIFLLNEPCVGSEDFEHDDEDLEQ